ncbi:MAG TPA: MFS transporter [Chroococcales cyanobacterium]
MSTMQVHDRVILLFFLLIGLFAFIGASLAPLAPLLMAELHLDYEVTAYHFTASSLGVISAGATGERIISLLGRQRALWIGAAGVCCGVLLFINGKTPTLTIPSIFLIGSFGSLIGQTSDTVISEQLGEKRAVVFTEANVICSLCASLAPLAIGACVGAGLGWRVALCTTVALYAISYLLFRRIAIPGQTEHHAQHAMKGTLPFPYWAYWVVILLSCAAEWSIVDWSAAFLKDVAHFLPKDAATSVTAFFAAMITARIIGSALSRWVSVHVLLPITAVFGLCGFFVFWLGPAGWVNLVGLFLTGFGIANIYPYTLAAALGVAPSQSALAASRMNIATGASGLFGPMALGCLAKQFGIFKAYAVAPMLLTLALVTILIANATAKRHKAEKPEQPSARPH